MTKKYLNKNVKFKCQNGNAVWFNVQNGSLKVKIKSSYALTDDCKLSIVGGAIPGQCNLILNPSNGTPMPCSSPIISGAWNNNSSVKISGKSVLTSDCSILCPVGGCIKPFVPTLMSIDVGDNANIQSVNILLNSDSNNLAVYNNEQPEPDGDEFDGEIKQTEKSLTDEDGIDVENALCDYKNCNRVKECKYLHTSCTIKEIDESKNASELKINMGKDAFDLYAGECAGIATSLYGSYMYSIAHHHIVPVNQCFKGFPEIVKLANYYNYNINKAENGICLPTMNQGYDKQPFEERKKIAFDAMEKLGRQWHKGGHKYSCKISVGLDNALPKPFLNYKDAVDRELTSLLMRIREDTKCRTDNYDQQALEFAKMMDRICERIAAKLRRFEDNPRKSYPCYISKLSFYFAFYNDLTEYEDELFGKDE